MSATSFNTNADQSKPITYIVTVPGGAAGEGFQEWLEKCDTAYTAIQTAAHSAAETRDVQFSDFQHVMGRGDRAGSFGFTFKSTRSLAPIIGRVHPLKKIRCCVAANPFAHEIHPMVTTRAIDTIRKDR